MAIMGAGLMGVMLKGVALALVGTIALAATGLRGAMPDKAAGADGNTADGLAFQLHLPYVAGPIDDGMELVYVPAGDFVMGSTDDDPDAFSDEKPRHTVYLDGYWIDKTEVTNAMFARFVDATGYKTDAETDGGADVQNQCYWRWRTGAYWRSPEGPGSDIAGRMSHPVVQTSWNDANAYCRWVGRRLPTEAEWEKAARGTDSREYPWGNAPLAGSLANFPDVNLGCRGSDLTQDDGWERTAPVGTYPAGASPYGALDMAGNVWEWVSDWYDSDYYAVSPRSNPPGPSAGHTRVVRGGAWGYLPRDLRSSARNYGKFSHPTVRENGHGFRCARP